VKPTAPLTGEAELANRKGTWSYSAPEASEDDGESVKPRLLDSAPEGGGDDLKQVKGIGPKLEKMCNDMGIYHFSQIASWTASEVAWVDANLEGFKGRVVRDDWVAQARLLAGGGETEFSKRVGDGGVY
jgi:predicted flap endonuclease-1-like 5' DNA nuclease